MPFISRGIDDDLKSSTSAMTPDRTTKNRDVSSRREREASVGPWVAVVMGSKSDLKYLQAGVDLLKELRVPHEVRIVSAHRTPDWMFEYASTAEARGLEVIIAAAGGAAHLPGMIASKTVLPVLGVPVPATLLNGLDSLLSIVQMPKGVPVGTLAIGEPGAANAALLAISIVSASRPDLRARLREWRAQRTAEVLNARDVPGS
jgi:5-(carboxyamino)imidazole ribonucleotide mutase